MLAELLPFVVSLSVAVGNTAATEGARSIDLPRTGAAYGQIVIPKLHERERIIQGTGKKQLKRGVGHFSHTYLPGMGGTISLFAHNMTPVRGREFGPFHYTKKLRKGDRIIMRMPYGRYVYRVAGHRIIAAKTWRRHKRLFQQELGTELLTLSSCFPDGKATHRYVVIARRLSG